MFSPRMWFDEVERVGKQRCTPLGSALHAAGDLIGFVGLLAVPGVLLRLASAGVAGSFRCSMLWLPAVPISLGLLGPVLVSFSWSLAHRRGLPLRLRAAGVELGRGRPGADLHVRRLAS